MNYYYFGRGPLTWQGRFIRGVFKFCCLLMLMIAMQGYTLHANAQRVTLKLKGKLEQVLSELTEQTGYGFVGDSRLLRDVGEISIDVSNENLETVLQKVFAQTNMVYTLEDRMVIYKAAQRGTVTGTIRASDGSVLAGASIRIKGTNITTTSDAAGRFTLTDVAKNAVLEVSYIGFVTQEAVASQGMEVIMQATSQRLQEAEVTVGYGKVQRKDLTGSISSLSEKDIMYMPYATVDNALMGRVAGVHVTKADGQPGGALRVQIRGTASITGDNEPLYVIDGVPIMPESPYITNSKNSISGGEVQGGFERGISPIAGLNIDDIQTIDILKDASASAIYGSRAANGVVIITTKSGVKSSKPIFSLDAYTGLSVAGRPDVLTADQFKAITREAARNNPTHSIAQQILSEDEDYFGPYETDWIDQVTRNARTQNLHMGIRGGTESTLYYTSLSVMDQKGTEIGSDYMRVAGKTNIDYSISPRLKIGTNLNYNHSISNVSMGLSRVAYQFRPDFPI